MPQGAVETTHACVWWSEPEVTATVAAHGARTSGRTIHRARLARVLPCHLDVRQVAAQEATAKGTGARALKWQRFHEA